MQISAHYQQWVPQHWKEVFAQKYSFLSLWRLDGYSLAKSTSTHTVHNWSPAFLLNYQTKAELKKSKFRKLLGNILWHVLVALFFFLNSRRWLIFFFVNLVGFYITKKNKRIRLPWHGKYFILHLLILSSRISMRVINSFPLLYYCYGIMIFPFTEWHTFISTIGWVLTDFVKNSWWWDKREVPEYKMITSSLN